MRIRKLNSNLLIFSQRYTKQILPLTLCTPSANWLRRFSKWSAAALFSGYTIRILPALMTCGVNDSTWKNEIIFGKHPNYERWLSRNLVQSVRNWRKWLATTCPADDSKASATFLFPVSAPTATILDVLAQASEKADSFEAFSLNLRSCSRASCCDWGVGWLTTSVNCCNMKLHVIQNKQAK